MTYESPYLAQVGPSGSGKTTALREIVGFEVGRSVSGVLDSRQERGRLPLGDISYVPQQLEITDGSLTGLWRDLFGVELVSGLEESAECLLLRIGLDGPAIIASNDLRGTSGGN